MIDKYNIITLKYKNYILSKFHKLVKVINYFSFFTSIKKDTS